MNRGFFWVIGISMVMALGIGIYFGLQALEPRTYTPTTRDSGFRIQDSENKTVVSAPPTPHPLLQPATLPVSIPTPEIPLKLTLSPATEKEAKNYFATSTPREINPSTLKLNLLDVRAVVYAHDHIVITERPSEAVATSLWQFNPKTKTLTAIVEKERGLMATWSKNGRFALLFSLNAQSIPQLRFIDTTLGAILPISFTTLPTKCTVTNEQIIYCGVPQSLPAKITLPDDYLKKKIYTDDTVVVIDVLNTRIENIFNGSGTAPDSSTSLESMPIDILNPMRINNALFFVNRYDEKVYKIEL